MATSLVVYSICHQVDSISSVLELLYKKSQKAIPNMMLMLKDTGGLAVTETEL